MATSLCFSNDKAQLLIAREIPTGTLSLVKAFLNGEGAVSVGRRDQEELLLNLCIVEIKTNLFAHFK